MGKRRTPEAQKADKGLIPFDAVLKRKKNVPPVDSQKQKEEEEAFELGRLLYGSRNQQASSAPLIDPEIPITFEELRDEGIATDDEAATKKELLEIRKLQPPDLHDRKQLQEIGRALGNQKNREKAARSLERHAEAIRKLCRFMEHPLLANWLRLKERGIRGPVEIERDIKHLAALLAIPKNPHRSYGYIQAPLEDWGLWERIPTKQSKADTKLNFKIAKLAYFFRQKSGKPHYPLVARIIWPEKRGPVLKKAVAAVKQAMTRNGGAWRWLPYLKLLAWADQEHLRLEKMMEDGRLKLARQRKT